MNESPVEVPAVLAEPHFEDEATVVSAQQVVPIEEARLHDRRRKLLVILPMLLAAAFCGGLVAIAVNYFEQRSNAPVISQPPGTKATEEKQQVTPSASPDNGAANSPDEPDASQAADSASTTDSPTAAASLDSSKAPKSVESVATVKKTSSSTDPKQLVRPRRVHPSSTQPRTGQDDQRKSRGAARIQDIFSGPNP